MNARTPSPETQTEEDRRVEHHLVKQAQTAGVPAGQVRKAVLAFAQAVVQGRAADPARFFTKHARALGSKPPAVNAESMSPGQFAQHARRRYGFSPVGSF